MGNLEKYNLVELEKNDLREITGGSEWTESIVGFLGAAAHTVYHCASAFVEGARNGRRYFYK